MMISGCVMATFSRWMPATRKGVIKLCPRIAHVPEA
jgi:hypothetical protein